MVHIEIEFTPDTLPQTDEEIRAFMAKAYEFNTFVRLGGKEKIRNEILKSLTERDDASISEIWNLITDQETPPVINAHPLTEEQGKDLQKGILQDFGGPKFKL